MTNQQQLYEHIIRNPDSLKEVFKYHDVLKIAVDILNASDAGKYYATLKFLQKFCTPVNVAELNKSGYRDGDPRTFHGLSSVINDWEFIIDRRPTVHDNTSDATKENGVGISDNYPLEHILEISKFPDYYQQYSWSGKHKLFGYPSDTYPGFHWINSLEKRFAWLCNNSAKQKTASKYLIQEMIEWGGSQNGVLQKFNDGSGEVNLFELVQKIISNLDLPEVAITNSLALPGLGLTYASKLLRFMRPGTYGALDSRIRATLLKQKLLLKIHDGNINSMVDGYLEFLRLLSNLKMKLEDQGIKKPDCSLSNTGHWRPSEIEMALFRWAELQ